MCHSFVPQILNLLPHSAGSFNGTDTDVTTDTFTIDQTDFTHSGDYECTALNSVTKRSVSQKHALLVKGKKR